MWLSSMLLSPIYHLVNRAYVNLPIYRIDDSGVGFAVRSTRMSITLAARVLECNSKIPLPP